jgi:poly(3-hydroxybutyrate) depolymerase
MPYAVPCQRFDPARPRPALSLAATSFTPVHTMLAVRLAAWSAVASSLASSPNSLPPVPSPGCSPRANKSGGWSAPPGATVQLNISILDHPTNFTAHRTLQLHLPRAYRSPKPVPVLLYFHMQTSVAATDAQNMNWTGVADAEGFAAVLPQGIGNEDGGNCDTGWNVGGTGSSACSELSWSPFGCHCACCYASCKRRGLCTDDGQGSRCGWSTCLDDVQFTTQLLAQLADSFCIDLSRIYLTGASNGGMLVHYLAARLPKTFAAILPIYGLALRNGRRLPRALAGTPILQLHDRWDNIVPLDGTASTQGWYYDSLAQSLGRYAALNGCRNHSAMSHSPTPFDGGARRLGCVEHVGCEHRARVMGCMFDGEHGDWMENGLTEALAWWFLSPFARNQTAPLPPLPPVPPPPPPSPPHPSPPPPPTPAVRCNPQASPPQLCPGNRPCPQCGKQSCLCPPASLSSAGSGGGAGHKWRRAATRGVHTEY